MVELSHSVLFPAAVDLALRSGSLSKIADAKAERSHHSSSSYALIAADGRLIERIPLRQVQHWARHRERVLARLEGRRTLARLPLEQRRRRFRARTDPQRALAWAISNGQPIPSGSFGGRELLAAGALLLLGLLPGIVFLIWAVPRGRRYHQAMVKLVRQWRAVGMPDPVDAAFQRLVGR